MKYLSCPVSLKRTGSDVCVTSLGMLMSSGRKVMFASCSTVLFHRLCFLKEPCSPAGLRRGRREIEFYLVEGTIHLCTLFVGKICLFFS